MELTLIKLGGSLITNKSKPYTYRPNTIKRLAQEIKRALQRNPRLNLIIGNGGGSFPHTSASKYSTANGYSTPEGKIGFCNVQHDASTINNICVKIFLRKGIPTIAVSPNTLFQTRDSKLTKSNTENIEYYLQQQIIPFVYGDTLIDTRKGSCIYSCDQVMESLADTLPSKKFKVIRIISVGDFPGVLDKNNKLVTLLTPSVYQDLLYSGAIKGSSNTDVTGGMRSKVETLLSQAKQGVESIILDGRKPNNLYKALTNKKISGTIIRG